MAYRTVRRIILHRVKQNNMLLQSFAVLSHILDGDRVKQNNMLLQSFAVLSHILDGDVAFDISNDTIRKSAIICT